MELYLRSPYTTSWMYRDNFTFAGIEPDKLHRFNNSSLKSYMKNQLTRVTRDQLTCSTEALLHVTVFNPLNAELNPICHLLALLGVHYIFQVSGLRVN